MTTPCSHQDNRKKVCGPCGRKIIFGKIKPDKFLISQSTEKLIKKFISKKFDLNDEKYPLCICRSCYLTLLDLEKEIFNRQVPTMPHYEELVLLKQTRLNNDCDCYVCLTAKSKGHIKVEKGRGKFRDINKEIDISTGFYESHKLEKLSLNKSSDSVDLNKYCSKCYQEIKRGKTHTCKNLRDNIISLVEKLPEKVQQQIATHVIKNNLESQPDLNGRRVNVDLNLSTAGRSTRITVNKIDKTVFFDEDKLDNFRVQLAASQREMKKITNFIRCNVGRMSIPKNYREHMSKKSKELKDVYKSGVHEFDCESGTDAEKQSRPVVYANAEELLDKVIESRGLVGNFCIKAMADGGQNFFKISLCIMPASYSPKNEESSMQEDCYDESDPEDSVDFNCPKKRTLYSEGGRLSKKGKLSSVNRLILLCVVPGIKETHANIQLLFDLTKLNDIPFKFVADFKLLLIVNGQQTATSSYPCPYCFVSLNELRRKSTPDTSLNGNTTSNESDELEVANATKLKTFGDLRRDFDRYQLLRNQGEEKECSRMCHSTINPPIFDEKDDVCVLEKCVIPELHVLQGFVNHLFWQGLVSLLGLEKALLWPHKLNLISKNYHGDAFEGNACRKLVKESDRLKDIEICGEVGIFKILPFIAAFKAMDKVVNCCFTSGKVGSSLDDYIEELKQALESIEQLSETLKIHVILSHVKEGFKFIENNNGLGFWSEQSGESIHRDFLKFWERYKVNGYHRETYLPNLLKAVVEFSSLHL